MESLTNEIAHKAWERIQEVEKLGGMAKAIETGIPKMRIEGGCGPQAGTHRLRRGRRSSASTNTAWRKRPRSTSWP
ncbi:MAG: methylmalonyl-CoA mutase family protein [Alistipes onderdonkii]